MRIGGSMMANATLRYQQNALQRTAGTLEKLASGYRVNRAGDDAAGLSIYEKIKAQIQGMERAGGNTADGINMIRTAEGALDGTHGTLQRMRELALQSASDTNETGVDRGALQAEYDQLMSELDDIGTMTRFNEKQLFAASVAGSDVQFAPGNSFTLQTGPNQGDETVLSIDAMVSGALGVGDTDIGTGEGARSAIARLDDAINRVSVQRAQLGAKENALGYKAIVDQKHPPLFWNLCHKLHRRVGYFVLTLHKMHRKRAVFSDTGRRLEFFRRERIQCMRCHAGRKSHCPRFGRQLGRTLGVGIHTENFDKTVVKDGAFLLQSVSRLPVAYVSHRLYPFRPHFSIPKFRRSDLIFPLGYHHHFVKILKSPSLRNVIFQVRKFQMTMRIHKARHQHSRIKLDPGFSVDVFYLSHLDYFTPFIDLDHPIFQQLARYQYPMCRYFSHQYLYKPSKRLRAIESRAVCRSGWRLMARFRIVRRGVVISFCGYPFRFTTRVLSVGDVTKEIEMCSLVRVFGRRKLFCVWRFSSVRI